MNFLSITKISFYLFCLLILFVSCSSKPAYTIRKFPNGKEIKVLNIGTMYNPSLNGPALLFNYETDANFEDRAAIDKEVQEIWNYFRLDAEEQGFKNAIIKVNSTYNKVFFMRLNKTRWFFFKKDRNNDWQLGDSSISKKELFDQGVTLIKGKNYDEAIAKFTKAIEMDPGLYVAYNGRGAAYCEKGNFNLAIVDLNKAIEINPNYAPPYNNRAAIYLSKKEYDKAWIDVHKAESLSYKINPELLEKLKKESGREK
ncbi:MAG: tetratricopeptide repeat protein [Candidatus Omnitrophica bacterium]|nr:tetratricopeptide repeat protein [Candidatus Omnitrophota bacterium]